MELKVIGSSSSGNCYALVNDNSILIIEAGINFQELKKAIDFQIQKIVGVLISHSHQDHSKYAVEYARYGLRVMASMETFKTIKFPLIRQTDVLQNKKPEFLGDFKIMPFDVVHDVPCFGFLIHHHETGNILFVTDTHYIKYKFPKLRTIMIECNYDQDILDRNIENGKLDPIVRNRVMQSHMSIDTVETMLNANDLSKTRNIVLMHLSGGNSDETAFIKRIENLSGKKTTIAKKGITLNINETPF